MSECKVCLAADNADPENLQALVRYLYVQLDRCRAVDLQVKTGIGPADAPPPQAVAPPSDLLEVLTSALGSDDIFRKPPRVAAPRLLARLTEAGWTLEQTP